MSATVSKVLTEARLHIATAAGDRGWDDTRQSWLARAASRLGMKYSRVFNVWYGRARPYADEIEEMRVKTTERAWSQRRAEERQHAVADQIQTLVGRRLFALEHQPSEGERGRAAATTGAAARPDAEG